jgi:uncharacterized 2Fe-2S/4Fe-4S cluster protein (DUF4445 family)
VKNCKLEVIGPDGGPPQELYASGVDDVSLAETLARAGVALNTRCGRNGLCAGCSVKLLKGSFLTSDGDIIEAPATIKTCQGTLANKGDATVSIPRRSLADTQAQGVSSFTVRVPYKLRPLCAPQSGVKDYGLAIDVGTTTVVVVLVDLFNGNIMGEEAVLNRQIALGDDVVTRIQLAADPTCREALRNAIVRSTLVPAIRALCLRADISEDRLGAATVAGNTTMLHLLVGADPSPMGVAPFRPQFTGHRTVAAGELGLDGLPPLLPVHLLPGFSAFVGADLAAGCACTGLMEEGGTCLLVDIGTNGEILLQHQGRLVGTATAAGPAFEGGRLTSGTRAVSGAIEHLVLSSKQTPPVLEMIPGGWTPVGICGSAYLDFLAQGRSAGLLDEVGRFSPESWATMPAEFRWEEDGQRGVYLRAADASTLVTEADVAQLQQAKAAIAAGILTLLHRSSLIPPDIHRLFLAGGFGLHLDPVSAIRSGLLPGFTKEQIEVVGNTSLGGAWLGLVDETKLTGMREIVRGAEILELNTDPSFEDTFIDQMALP